MSTENVCQTEYYYTGALIDQRYRLTEFIGVGGMACVYKAQEEGSPHTYAIKFLKTEYHNQPYLIDYFRDEASSMRDLAHPNIVRFYRFVNNDHYSYIIMDYVDGFSLSDIIKRVHRQDETIPLDEVVRIITQVARALDAIHREGYVHRDIKPSNVLIERQSGQTFLTDLGITSTSNTRLEGAGTVAYMSPEHAETWVADYRSDVYSFAILCYEMLAKRRPFHVERGLKGKEAEEDLLRKHKEDPVPDITQFRPDLPSDLNAVFQRGLAKQPDERYQSVLDFARELHAALIPQISPELHEFSAISHRQITPPDPSTEDESKVQPLMQRTPLAIGALATVILVGIVLYLLFGNDSTALPADPTPEATEALAEATSTPTEHPLAGQATFLLAEGASALANADSLRLEATPSLHYLRVGMVDGFELRMQVANTEGLSRYGLAFRVQDAGNYLLFTLDSGARWEFSEVLDGELQRIDQGTLEAAPQSLTIRGLGEQFQVEADETRLELRSERFATGSLALYVDGNSALALTRLSVALLGSEAEAAAAASPTPAQGLVNPRQELRQDVTALLATNDVLNTAIDCPAYIPLYESLARYEDVASAEVWALAQNVQEVGRVVYSRCRSESPTAPLSFTGAIQDYLDWEANLEAIQAQLES